MKTKLLAFAALCCMLTITGCDEKKDQVSQAKDHNEQKFDDETEKTADFLVYAADLSLHAKQLADLATGNAVSNEVKKLAKESRREHEKALDDLHKIAKEKNISLPEATSDEHQKDCDKLGKKKGREFDHDYSDLLVKDNEKALSRFEKAAEKDKDEVVRKWAFEMLPVLRTQLDFAMSCREKEGNGSADTAVVLNNKSALESPARQHDDKAGKTNEKETGKNKKTDW